MLPRNIIAFLSIAASSAALAGGFYGVGEVTHASNSLDRDYFDNTLRSAGALNLSSKDNRATNRWRLQGGYAFDKYFSLEAGYIDFGTVDYKAEFNGGSARASLKAGGIDVAGRLSMPLSDSFSVFAKAGVVAVKAKSQVTSDSLVPALDTHSSTNSVRPLLGVGATYSLNQNWDVRTDYDQVSNMGKSSSTGTMTSRMFSLGAVYKF